MDILRRDGRLNKGWGLIAGTFPASTSTRTIVLPSEAPSTACPFTAAVSSVIVCPSCKIRTNLPCSLDLASVPTRLTTPSAGAGGASATNVANDLSSSAMSQLLFLTQIPEAGCRLASAHEASEQQRPGRRLRGDRHPKVTP
jgi:hypothetical protein